MASTRRRENTRGNNSIDIITSLHSFTDEGENREHAHEHSEYQPSDIISEQDGEISPTNAKSKQKRTNSPKRMNSPKRANKIPKIRQNFAYLS